MKTFWVDARQWDKKIVTTALESGADAVLVGKGYSDRVKELGLIKTVAEDGDIKLGKQVIEVEINSKEDEIAAAKLSARKTVVVKTKDWKIIPLENLIAQSDSIIAEVYSAGEAGLALGTLEKGVAGILLNSGNLDEIIAAGKLVKQQSEKLGLVEAKIVSTRQLGSGDRVCVDTCTNMKIGQGMLVGDASDGMLLVHSESIENPYVEQRPFRVNAGAVHAYVRMPGNKTKYLNDLKRGDTVLIVDSKGNTQTAVLGRTKIERRPLMLVEASVGEKPISLVLQNAETIRLVVPPGKPISVIKLKKGDAVLGFVEEAGRHFGMKVKESIVEK